MDRASEALLALKPVTFHYKKDIDPAGTSLVIKKENPYSVRYEAVNAMLLNEFLKEHRKVEEQQGTIGQLKSCAAKQEATIGELKSGMQALIATVKEQAAQIQKVSAELEVRKPAPQVATNP